MTVSLTFPTTNGSVHDNRRVRQGYVKLVAFGDVYDENGIDSLIIQSIDKLTNTAREYHPTFQGTGVTYLKNLLINANKAKKQRVKNKIEFTCILPIPLDLSDKANVEWNSTTSAYTDALYGRIAKKNARDRWVASHLHDAAEWVDSKTDSTAGTTSMNFVDRLINSGVSTGAMVSGTVGGIDLRDRFMNNHLMQRALRNSTGNKLLGSIGAQEGDMYSLWNEAAATGGTRQVILDPGKWQQFAGVNPRDITLS